MSAPVPSPKAITALCRDCLAEFVRQPGPCPRCGSGRMIRHAELGRLSMAHIDCDAFYAAVEKRDNPALKDKPVLIGGGKRGVVSTACYIARQFGPRSAMPMFKALKLCPQAIVIKPDMAKYKKASDQVRAIFDTATPLVEPLSMDEAFLDLSGTATLFARSPAATLAHIAREVESRVGITVSIGLSYNKFLAKMASDMDKPRGFAVVGQKDAVQIMHDMPITKLPGVGPSLADRLKIDGLFTIGDIQRKSEDEMGLRYGDTGAYLSRLSRGIDGRQVNTERESKTVSSETTFDTDIKALPELKRRLWPLCERVAERLKAGGLAGRSVVLKLKNNRFRLTTRHVRLSTHTQLAEIIYRAAEKLLAKEATGTPYRLIGVGVDDLGEATLADQPDLFDADKGIGKQRIAGVERAMDAVRAKFGRKAIRKGRADK